jgi:hypothetical protein
VTAAGRLDLQRALEGSRERLAALADRLALVRLALGQGGAGVAAPATAAAAAGPFGGSDARPIDDLELTFQAVDGDGAGDAGVDAGVDQDKAR